MAPRDVPEVGHKNAFKELTEIRLLRRDVSGSDVRGGRDSGREGCGERIGIVEGRGEGEDGARVRRDEAREGGI